MISSRLVVASTFRNTSARVRYSIDEPFFDAPAETEAEELEEEEESEAPPADKENEVVVEEDEEEVDKALAASSLRGDLDFTGLLALGLGFPKKGWTFFETFLSASLGVVVAAGAAEVGAGA